MCGLFGAISGHTLSLNDIDTITELGVVSSIRGIDSTGVAVVQRAKKGKLEIKQRHGVTNPTSFMYTKENQTLMKDKFLVMGHARDATSGQVNIANAHPIHEGRFIGCHNGTIWNYSPLKADEHKLTDSRLLYRAMQKEGTITALKRVGSGAYALSYIDTHQRTMNFIRNKDRTLYLMESTGGTTFLWASEYRFLKLAAWGSNLTWKDPMMLQPYMLYQFDISKGNLHLLTKDYKDELDGYVTILPPVRPAIPSTMYCRICTNCMDNCNCEHPKYIRPFEYQISKDGKTFTPDPKEDHKKPVTELLSSTSVPGVYNASALTPYCTRCQKEKQFCFCDVKPRVLTSQEKDKLATGKRYSSFKTGEPHYVAYKRWEYTPAEAKKKLQEGCCECHCVCGLDVKTYWVDEDYYFCEDCHKDEKVIETMKGTSTWLGKLIHAENYSATKH